MAYHGHVLPGLVRTLPRPYYTSRAIYREEAERIFSRRWVCVGRTARLPEAGDYYSIFPNLFLTLLPDYAMWHTLEPLAFDRTRIVCEWLFAAGAPEAGAKDAVAFWDVTNRQDWHVCELAQQGISSRAYTPGPYATQESLLAAFDRELLAALGRTDRGVE
jgi:phenylpropionate dioxygenase-like ring-hydroxylating dioxygenase large terminal subunit